MATNNNKKFAGSKVTTEQGVDDLQTKPYEPVLSAEQRRTLAQVYRLILSWRRERLSKTVPVLTTSDTNMVSTKSVQAIAVEAEA